MNHINILKRAWQILWGYKALWLFGVLLALTTTSWQSATWAQRDRSQIEEGAGVQLIVNDELTIWLPGEGLIVDLTNVGGLSVKFKSGEAWQEMEDLRELVGEIVPSQFVSAVITILIFAIALIAFLYILGQLAQYVAEVAIIYMVGNYQRTGDRLTIRQGLRVGWSRNAWKLFLIDLTIVLPVFLGLVLLFLLVLTPLLLWMVEDTTLGVIGTLTSVGLFFPLVVLILVVAALITVLLRFFHRACVLEELGVRASIAQGFYLVRSHWTDVIVMWLIMFGLGIAWIMALVPLGLILIPLIVVMIVVGVAVGALPALLTVAIANLFIQGVVPWILGVLVGLPFFILIVASPLIFLSGLWHTYRSSAWTLTYYELRGLEVPQPEILPELAPGAA